MERYNMELKAKIKSSIRKTEKQGKWLLSSQMFDKQPAVIQSGIQSERRGTASRRNHPNVCPSPIAQTDRYLQGGAEEWRPAGHQPSRGSRGEGNRAVVRHGGVCPGPSCHSCQPTEHPLLVLWSPDGLAPPPCQFHNHIYIVARRRPSVCVVQFAVGKQQPFCPLSKYKIVLLQVPFQVSHTPRL